MRLIEELRATPSVAGIDGLPDAWHWSVAPGLDSCAALAGDGEHVFGIHARDSYDEDLAIAILSFARQHRARLIGDRPLAVAEGFACPGYAFDAVVAVGPAIHRLYAEDGELNASLRVLVPAFRCEFAGDEDAAEAEHHHTRASGVPGTKWGREPRPFLKMRFRGDNGHLPARRWFAGPKLLVSWITRKAGNADLFVEFENYRREVYTVEWSDTWTLAVAGAAPVRTGREGLLNILKSTLYGPNVAAGTGEFPG